MYILGISAYFHDSAACLLKDDVIVAAVQEERFSRKKNDDSFPLASISYCLGEAGIKLKDVDHVVFYEKPFIKFERLLETYLTYAPRGFNSFIKSMSIWLKDKLFLRKNIIRALTRLDNRWDRKRLLFTSHHQSHAASAFFPSPFSEAVILTMDGVGEWATASVSFGSKNKIKLIKEIRFPHSVGLLYSTFTYYLGFKVNCDEYKVMGLAPYGKPIYLELIFDKLINLKSDGSFSLNMIYFNYCTGLTMASDLFDELFGHPRRSPSAEITQFHMDVASSIQVATEVIMLTLTKALKEEYQTDNLCMAGGVALNCVANGKILKQSGFKNLWVQPAAGDAGGALGAAFAAYYLITENPRLNTNPGDKMKSALLGPSYKAAEIREMLIRAQIPFEELYGVEYYRCIAGYLASGKVVGYFKGRMEFGPRALGARSILADPRNAEMQSILNQKIKFRESFRPFASAVLDEDASTYFEMSGQSPYMLLAGNIQPDLRIGCANNQDGAKGFEKFHTLSSVIPAVTHVDYSSRIQTVNLDSHPDFYELISAFKEITEVPILVNTSFNRMDEPIVNTPQEALTCFYETDMDILVMEDFIIKKQPSAHEQIQ